MKKKTKKKKQEGHLDVKSSYFVIAKDVKLTDKFRQTVSDKISSVHFSLRLRRLICMQKFHVLLYVFYYSNGHLVLEITLCVNFDHIQSNPASRVNCAFSKLGFVTAVRSTVNML